MGDTRYKMQDTRNVKCVAVNVNSLNDVDSHQPLQELKKGVYVVVALEMIRIAFWPHLERCLLNN